MMGRRARGHFDAYRDGCGSAFAASPAARAIGADDRRGRAGPGWGSAALAAQGRSLWSRSRRKGQHRKAIVMAQICRLEGESRYTESRGGWPCRCVGDEVSASSSSVYVFLARRIRRPPYATETTSCTHQGPLHALDSLSEPPQPRRTRTSSVIDIVNSHSRRPRAASS